MSERLQHLWRVCLRGRYQGAFGMSWGIGHVLAPIIGVHLFAWDARMLWVSCLGLCVIGGLMVGLVRRRGELTGCQVSAGK